ncbi:MAG: HlyD family efflux transporter periplasmic adaptor subunit [Saprospiraceae bacterium]
MNIRDFIIFSLAFCFLTFSCKRNGFKYDASGVFESDEIIVSAEVTGRILNLNIEEGSLIKKDSVVGNIDPMQYTLQKEQLEFSIKAVESKSIPSLPQIRILESQVKAQQEQIRVFQLQLNSAKREKSRLEKLVKAEAAPGKQLDDANSQLDIISQQLKAAESQVLVTRQQIVSQRALIAAQNAGISSEEGPLEKRKEMAEDYLNKSKIINPLSGNILTIYMHAGEVVTPGKAIYKIADLSKLNLRAYINGSQLSKVKLNQEVSLHVEYGDDEDKEYIGQIIWISDQAEFTPKTIQTKEERSNLVYAIKIKVVNDGFLKLGMYGEVQF